MSKLEKFIVDPKGQYNHPGKKTKIPNADGSITMKGVPYPVLGIDDEGNQQMMYPNRDYQFPGNSVYEIPMAQFGFEKKEKEDPNKLYQEYLKLQDEVNRIQENEDSYESRLNAALIPMVGKDVKTSGFVPDNIVNWKDPITGHEAAFCISGVCYALTEFGEPIKYFDNVEIQDDVVAGKVKGRYLDQSEKGLKSGDILQFKRTSLRGEDKGGPFHAYLVTTVHPPDKDGYRKVDVFGNSGGGVQGFDSYFLGPDNKIQGHDTQVIKREIDPELHSSIIKRNKLKESIEKDYPNIFKKLDVDTDTFKATAFVKRDNLYNYISESGDHDEFINLKESKIDEILTQFSNPDFKKNFMKQQQVSNDEYDAIVKNVIGIYGAESKFGTGYKREPLWLQKKFGSLTDSIGPFQINPKQLQTDRFDRKDFFDPVIGSEIAATFLAENLPLLRSRAKAQPGDKHYSENLNQDNYLDFIPYLMNQQALLKGDAYTKETHPGRLARFFGVEPKPTPENKLVGDSEYNLRVKDYAKKIGLDIVPASTDVFETPEEQEEYYNFWPKYQDGGAFNPDTDEFIGYADELPKDEVEEEIEYSPSRVILRELGNIRRYDSKKEGIIKEPYKNSHEVYMDKKGWRNVSPEEYQLLLKQYPGADKSPGWIRPIKKAQDGLQTGEKFVEMDIPSHRYYPDLSEGETFIKDARVWNPVTNAKIVPTRDLKGGHYSNNVIRRIVEAAYRNDMLPHTYTGMSMALQETNLGKTDPNLGHVIDVKPYSNPTPEDDLFRALKEKYKEADRLGYKNDPLQRLQTYNGNYLTRDTEKEYHKGQSQAFYGVPVPEEGINLRKNPLYAKKIFNLRDSVLLQNPELINFVNKATNEYADKYSIEQAQKAARNVDFTDMNQVMSAMAKFAKTNPREYKRLQQKYLKSNKKQTGGTFNPDTDEFIGYSDELDTYQKGGNNNLEKTLADLRRQSAKPVGSFSDWKTQSAKPASTLPTAQQNFVNATKNIPRNRKPVKIETHYTTNEEMAARPYPASGSLTPVYPEALLMAGPAANMAKSALGTVGTAMNLPFTVGATTIPGLTANNLLTGYFASKVPGNLQEGEYINAALNGLPMVGPILRESYNAAKTLPFFKQTPSSNNISRLSNNTTLGNPIGNAEDLRSVNPNFKTWRDPDTGNIVYQLDKEDYAFGNDWETIASKDFKDYITGWLNTKPNSGGYSEIPEFNEKLRELTALASYGKRAGIKSFNELKQVDKAKQEMDRIRYWGPSVTDLNPSDDFYKMWFPGGGKAEVFPNPKRKPFTGIEAFQKINPNKYGGSIYKNGGSYNSNTDEFLGYTDELDSYQDKGQVNYTGKKGIKGEVPVNKEGLPYVNLREAEITSTNPNSRPNPYSPASLKDLFTFMNPMNWGVNDYSNAGTFNKAYSSAKKSGEEDFLFNNKRYNTKYAGTPRQEVGAYGINGKPIDLNSLDYPAHVNLYPPFGRYLPGHISASTGDDNYSVDYSAYGNRNSGILHRRLKPGEQSFNVYNYDNDVFEKKAINLPEGKHAFNATRSKPSDWNLFTNNCADNVCDAFGIPRDAGLQYPSEALEKIKRTYPTLDVTGRTHRDYGRMIRKLKNPKDLLNKIDEIIGIISSPDISNSSFAREIVEKIQEALSKEGYGLPKSTKIWDENGKSGSFDGVLGEETKEALADWKSKNKNKKKEGGENLPTYQKKGQVKPTYLSPEELGARQIMEPNTTRVAPVVNHVKEAQYHAQAAKDVANPKITDDDFRDKHGYNKHVYQMNNDPQYRAEVEANAKITANKNGSIDYPSTYMDSKSYTGNPNLNYMIPNGLTGEARKGYEESQMNVVGAALPIPGLQQVGRVPSVLGAGKNAIIAAGKTLDKFGNVITTQTPLRNAYKLNPYALKEKDIDMLWRWQADNLPAGLLKVNAVPAEYTGRWFQIGDPTDVFEYMKMRPGPGTLKGLALPKGVATLPEDAAKFTGAEYLKDVERIVPTEALQNTTNFRLENNPFLPGKVDNPNFLEDFTGLQPLFKNAKVTPHWFRGYPVNNTGNINMNEIMSLAAPKGNMYGQNQVLVQQSRLLNPATRAKFFQNQAPEINATINRDFLGDRIMKVPKDFNNRITPENYEEFVNRIHGSTGYNLASDSWRKPTNLGIGNYNKTGTVFSDAPLNNLGKDIINAHEKNHGMFAGTLSAEMSDDLLRPFGTKKVIPHYQGKHQADEVLARMGQFKNAIGMGDDQIFTLGHLNLIRKNYANSFIDNGITEMLKKIKPGSKGEKEFLKNMNKYAFGSAPFIIGAGALKNKKQGGTFNPNTDEFLGFVD